MIKIAITFVLSSLIFASTSIANTSAEDQFYQSMKDYVVSYLSNNQNIFDELPDAETGVDLLKCSGSIDGQQPIGSCQLSLYQVFTTKSGKSIKLYKRNADYKYTRYEDGAEFIQKANLKF